MTCRNSFVCIAGTWWLAEIRLFIHSRDCFIARHLTLSPILVHEFLVELYDPSHPFRTRCQKRRSKMHCAFLLSKTCSWHKTYSCRIQQPQAIELVWLTASFLRRLDRLLRQLDRREEIHCALVPILSAFNAFERKPFFFLLDMPAAPQSPRPPSS